MRKKQDVKQTDNGGKKSLYGRLSYPKKKALWGFIFLIPWLFGILKFFLRPLINIFWFSLNKMTLQSGGFDFQFVGLDNFKYILTVDPDFTKELVAAIGSMLYAVPVQIFVSLFLAMLLNGKFPGRGAFRVIFFIPIILATGLLEFSLRDVNMIPQEAQAFVNANGLVNVLTSSGFPSQLLDYVLNAVNAIFELITFAGVQILIYLSGLQNISPSLYEVAKLEGCSQFEIFCKITLPMISPMILVCMVYSIAEAFATNEISTLIRTTTFSNVKYGEGSAMSAVYFLVTVAITLICTLIVSKVVFYYDE